MKKIQWLSMALLCLLLFSGCVRKQPSTFAPDGIWQFGNQFYVANKAENALIRAGNQLNGREAEMQFPSAVTDLITANGSVWVITEDVNGKLYQLDPMTLEILSETALGHTPSALLYNPSTQSFWITQRHNNAVWEVDPNTATIQSRIPVGREPMALLSVANDSLLLVANNLPEMASTDFPIACQLDLIDTHQKQVVKRIQLPNGSTDVKAMTADRDQQYAYVVHLLARYQLPTNQVDRGWMSTNVMSIINLQTGETENTVLLDTPQRGAANPWDIALSADEDTIWVALAGSHELAAINRPLLHQRLDAVHRGEKPTPSTIDRQHVPNDAGFLYGIREFYSTAGKGPRALCSTNEGVYATNYFSGNVVRLNGGKLSEEMTTLHPLTATQQGLGNLYFHDATLGFQQWQSCASCHPNDARVDGLNWDLLNDGMGNPKNTKTLVLSHQTPPCMVTGIRKNAETAVRSGMKHILFAAPNEPVAQAMDLYLKSVQPTSSPYLENGALSEAGKRGKDEFEKHCASCHSGSHYTDGNLYAIHWTTGSETGKKMDTPALKEVWRTAPYLYDGRSYELRDMLEIHGPQEQLSAQQLNDLAIYVLSL